MEQHAMDGTVAAVDEDEAAMDGTEAAVDGDAAMDGAVDMWMRP